MPGMQPATAVAASNSASSTSTTSPASANRAVDLGDAEPSVPGTSRNDAQAERGGDVGHDARDAAPGGRAACSRASDTPAATETTGRVAERGADAPAARPRRAAAGRRRSPGRPPRRARPRVAAAAPPRRGGELAALRRVDVEEDESGRVGHAGPAPALGQGVRDVPGADETDVHGRVGELRTD